MIIIIFIVFIYLMGQSFIHKCSNEIFLRNGNDENTNFNLEGSCKVQLYYKIALANRNEDQ